MSQRKSHTCIDCSRRKIKCDKVIPCSNCTKKGRADTCRRADDPPLEAELQLPASILKDYDRALGLGSGSTNAGKESTIHMVTALAERVQQLEVALQLSRKRNAPTDDAELATEQFSSSRHLLPLKQPKLSKCRSNHSSLPISDERGAQDESQNSSEAEVEDAATVLEFLAWGRLKDSAATSSVRNTTSDPTVSVEPVHAASFSNFDTWGASPTSVSNATNFQVEVAQLTKLQDMLPSREQVYQMIEFHEDWLLWMHSSWITTIFNNELDEFYSHDHGTIGMTSSKIQWAALLLAILTTSMASAKRSQLDLWGFSETDQSLLAKRWYQATIDCLQVAKYQQNHLVYGCQAISTLTIAAHVLGFSNTQSVLIASAIRICQALGLHRLRAEKGEHNKDLSIRYQKEAGRRLWQQLVTQDWFSVPFSETYCVNPMHFTSKQPGLWDDRTMLPVAQGDPAITSYGNFLFSIACLMPRLLDRMCEAQTLHTKYEQVLHFDRKMRDIATTQLPACLSSQTPLNPNWPCWINVARRNLTVTSAHKIIMIHRTYLGLSFSDDRFAFTRKTCIAAAKTMLNEFKQDEHEESPLLWTMQAFSVAAAIILSLDNFNQKHTSREYQEHRTMVSETIEVLSHSVGISSIAARGTRLLTDLLAEEQAIRKSGKTGSDSALKPPPHRQKAHRGSTSLNVSEFVKKFCEADQPLPQPESPTAHSHMPLWLHEPPTSETNEYRRGSSTRQHSMTDPRQILPTGPVSSSTTESHGYAMPYPNLFSQTTQEHFGNPFGQNFAETFDIRTVNWFDDLLGLVPSHSL